MMFLWLESCHVEAKPKHLYSPLLMILNNPSHSAQRQCSSRRRNVDACAVEHDIVRAEHIQLKSVLGIGG